MQHADAKAQRTMIMPVDDKISFIPTNGDTIPPAAKQIDPNHAEAVPEFSRWHSMANVVVEVKVSPTQKSKARSKPS